MTESPAKSLSVELDVDAIKPIVSGLRSYGEGVVAGLKSGERFPTVWDAFKQSIGDGWMIKGGGLKAGDLVADWQWYTRAQTGSVEHPEMLSSASQEIYQRKIVAQIRNLLWGGTSLSLPWNMWESLGVAAWGGGEFKQLYADSIRSILREKYILSAHERKEVPSLSPNSFWLLLSLSPLGLDIPVDMQYEPVPEAYSTRSCAYFPYKYIEYLKARESRMKIKASNYIAVSEMRTIAHIQSQDECWVGFWDQWFLGEIFNQRSQRLNMNFVELQRHLKKMPLFSDKSLAVKRESGHASIPKPPPIVPSWYANNTGYV